MEQKIYDISMPVNVKTKIYPGDPIFEYRCVQNIANGDNFCVSEVKMNMHTGTHIDAPLHFIENGEPIGNLKLDYFIGTCQVFHINTANRLISIDDLPVHNKLMERVLFRTMQNNVFYKWSDNFMGLSIELIDYLHNKGVKLVGIDTPSVDTNESEPNAHKRLFDYKMIIVENLYLNNVPKGIYELIALPLKFTELEASPVRAILRTL